MDDCTYNCFLYIIYLCARKEHLQIFCQIENLYSVQLGRPKFVQYTPYKIQGIDFEKWNLGKKLSPFGKVDFEERYMLLGKNKKKIVLSESLGANFHFMKIILILWLAIY